jgi:hypothetical protein
MWALRSLLVLSLLALLLATTTVHSEPVSSVYYLLVYSPLENSGVLVVNTSISLPNCDYVSIPVGIFGEEAKLEFLNYTVSGNLLVAGVDYNEITGYLVVFACNSGEISVLFTASNVLSEMGLGAYTGEVDTTPLRDLGATSTVEIRVTGVYDVDVVPVGVTYSVDRTEDTTIIVIKGHGYAYISLTGIIEVIETPTPTPTPTPAPPAPYDITTIIIVGAIAGLILAVAVIAILARRK